MVLRVECWSWNPWRDYILGRRCPLHFEIHRHAALLKMTTPFCYRIFISGLVDVDAEKPRQRM